MIIGTEDLAAGLRRCLQRRLGHMPNIAQVDFVDCETGDDVMAYCYYDGDECEPICFTRPPFFDPVEVESAMIRGGLKPARVH